MKIAYLVSHFPAPSHTFIRREIDALKRSGVDVHVMSIRQPKKVEILSDTDAEAHRDTFYIFPPKPVAALKTFGRYLLDRPARMAKALYATQAVRNPGFRELVYGFLYYAEGVLLAEEMERQGVQHLHCHFANAASQAAMAAALIADLPFSLTLHGMGDFDHPGGTTLGKKLALARFVVSATEYGVAQAKRLSDRAQWKKLGVVRCGIEVERLPEPQKRPEGSRFRFICVSRLSPEKGQLGLLEAFAEARRRGLDAELVLVGDGPDRPAIEAETANLGLEADVQLRGRLAEQDTLAEVARSDAMVMGSLMEGLPVSLMEALGIGIPVIAPNITGIPELVVPLETGLVYTVGRWSELADRMLELSRDPAARARMAENGRRRVREEFDVDAAVASLRRWFEASAGAKAPLQAAASEPETDRRSA